MTIDKRKVVYQLYPKSFKDTTGSGTGDLRGIIEKLPYLADLGIDVIWLNPFYPSPQRDNGYDISDYTAVHPDFGSMADFEELVKKGKEYGIELMLDMVLNHCSTDHEWFQKALNGDPFYQDFFILRDQPTDWLSKFGGSAWSPFSDTGRYYLHLFDTSQADLNWRNPHVRKELFAVVNFWKEKGVKGFRFDVINLIGKDAELNDCPIQDGKPAYTDRPITHDYLRMMNHATFGKEEGFLTVGEMSATTIENCILYTAPEREELSMAFNFHHLKVDYKDGNKWTLMEPDIEQLKQLFHSWGEEMSAGNGWNALFYTNHDQPRALNRFVDVDTYRVEGATMLAASIHLSRGTPYIYMGEEIGMLDPDYDSMADYRDIEALNAYQELLRQGHSPSQAFAIIKAKSRDNARSPMQWDASPHAGFTTGQPWIPVGKSYQTIHVEAEKNGPIFTFYQQLIRLRKENPLIAEGSYHPAYQEVEKLYAFERKHHNQQLLVLTNFSAQKITIPLSPDYVTGTILIDNYTDTLLQEQLTLKPYQALAIQISKDH